ncbi:MAG: VOC family protein [Dehalococcoidia bacterium]
MTEQQIPPVVPSLVVNDMQGTLDWFAKLGFETAFTMTGPDGSIAHAEVRRGPVHFMMGPAGWGGTPGSTGMRVYINLQESIDAYHDSVRATGVTISDPLADQFWGDRTFTVQHPDGYGIMFSEHIRDVSPEEMDAAMKEMAGASA